MRNLAKVSLEKQLTLFWFIELSRVKLPFRDEKLAVLLYDRMVTETE